MTTESVYERRCGWLDRLRRRFGDGHEDERQEPLFNDSGEPTYVVVKGEPIGIRDTKGGVIEFPKLPSDPAKWPGSMWEDVGDQGWIRVRRRDWWR